MNVIVFGATGTVGRLAVARCLEAGHRVTAFARRPDRLDISHPDLTLHAGDAAEPGAVADALRGHQAVIVTIGAGAARGSTIRSRATLNVIRGMQAHGVRRLVCQTTLGARESRGNLNFFWKQIMFGLLLRPVLEDHEWQERLVEASGLDWTIVRPSSFADGPATGDFREGFAPTERRLKLTIRRADIAAFLNRQVVDRTYLHRAVGIST